MNGEMNSDLAGQGTATTPGTVAKETRKSFFVGGVYGDMEDGQRMTGQIYVQYRSPQHQTQPYPIVMIHGGGQTGINFETTPDGRPGWADYFVDLGFGVYIVDQPARGRSPYVEELQGPQRLARAADYIEEHFTAMEAFDPWPQAKLHTQWPGTGRVGDPIFDQFYASQVSGISDHARSEELMRPAGAALLDQIGPAILLTHSQSGPEGWHICDARPSLVKAILAIEPGIPPFFGGLGELTMSGDILAGKHSERPYGITVRPITYDPPVTDPASELIPERELTPDEPDLICCYALKGPARRLVNLSECPVLVVTAEASQSSGYSHCTVKYLTRAGVDVTPFFLGQHGIHGNGHMMMLEKNNLEIAEVLYDWLVDKQVAK